MYRRIFLLAASIACWAVVITPASAQEFKQIASPALTRVAAGREEVWGLSSAQNVYRFNPSTMKFVQVPGQLTQIAVGGGSLLQSDVVWGLDAAGDIFQYNFSTKKLVQVPGYPLREITVGAGYTDSCHPYEVWGTSAADEDGYIAVIRYNSCTSEFEGFLSGGLFGPALWNLQTGGGDVWALDVYGEIYQYNFVTQQFTEVPGSLAQIVVGQNDVWGINSAGHALRFEGAAGFVLIDSSKIFSQIAAGGNGAWGLEPIGTIVRFDPNVAIAVTVPGSLTQIAVGYGAGIWGVNSAGGVYAFVRP